MADTLQLPVTSDREVLYTALLPQVAALLKDETDSVAAMANVAAALRQGLGFFWVGFYRVMGEELVLGPFQGDVACTRIGYGKGVCGAAWQRAEVLVVPDVDAFPGHIACSSLSRSEVVVPVVQQGRVVAVLDVDSTRLADFGPTDARYLAQVCALLPPL
jgi:L-methionine (R)-S-oxide reductase